MPKQNQSEPISTAFLRSTPNTHTRRARRLDLEYFKTVMGTESEEWLRLDGEVARERLQSFLKLMQDSQVATTTINRRLATMRALVRFARTVGATQLEPDALIGEVECAPNAVTVLSRSTLAEVCQRPDLQSVKGRRDRAILHLLCEVPLFGWQMGALQAADFDAQQQHLMVPVINSVAYENEPEDFARETKPAAKYPAQLSDATAQAINCYLSQCAAVPAPEAPLFCNFDRRPQNQGKGIVPKSVLHIVKQYGAQIGLPTLNARTLRLTAIVNALKDANGSSAVAAERFRHVDYGTWEYYRLAEIKEEENGKESLSSE
jgi:integrase/recombinase XerC